jgi:hypothetical protein
MELPTAQEITGDPDAKPEDVPGSRPQVTSQSGDPRVAKEKTSSFVCNMTDDVQIGPVRIHLDKGAPIDLTEDQSRVLLESGAVRWPNPAFGDK